MGQEIRLTTAVAKVLAALVSDPDADRYGLDLMHDTGLPSGTLYPIMVRLQRAGWVEASWEEIDPVAAGRPARRYYRLTPDGLASARSELAALHASLTKGSAPGKLRTA
ncbi:PadR family transcriptional regulator [Longispora albida]|uniref:PadR family transcriptional regulator n=1 Tax=Longispora albida TaxID=203523 RepID=UPI00037F9432|nr:helix-turn-helix transcriptional regulator [Longispora albida]